MMDDPRIKILAADSGVSSELLTEFVVFALQQARVARLAPNDTEFQNLRQSRKCLEQFELRVSSATGRTWAFEEVKSLWAEVLLLKKHKVREPIALEAILGLLFNKPQVCTICGKQPPDVKLEIDHCYPVSKGGRSVYHNLRLLCLPCNRSKSDKVSREYTNA